MEFIRVLVTNKNYTHNISFSIFFIFFLLLFLFFHHCFFVDHTSTKNILNSSPNNMSTVNNPVIALTKMEKMLQTLLKKLDLSRLPEIVYLIGLDLESTGLSVVLDRFVQLGAPLWIFNRITGVFHRLNEFMLNCKQDRRMHPKSIEITGITQEFVDSQLLSARDVLERFRDFLNQECKDQVPRICVGFNVINYDFPMMIIEAERCGLGGKAYFQSLKLTSSLDLFPIAQESLETTKLQRRPNGMPSFALGSVYKALMGKVLEGAHNSLLDARGTLEVLEAGYAENFKPQLLAAMSPRPDTYQLKGVFNAVNLVAGCLIKLFDQQKRDKNLKEQVCKASIDGVEPDHDAGGETTDTSTIKKRPFFQSTTMDVMARLADFADRQRKQACLPSLDKMSVDIISVENDSSLTQIVENSNTQQEKQEKQEEQEEQEEA